MPDTRAPAACSRLIAADRRWLYFDDSTTIRLPAGYELRGVIAAELRVPLHRVIHVLASRQHIRPAARAGILRLYDRQAVAMVRHELNAIDARRCRRAP